jgi:hypothetical protein
MEAGTLMINEKLCCDLEHSKLLAETGLMREVENDGFFTVAEDGTYLLGSDGKPNYIDGENVTIGIINRSITVVELQRWLPTYRLDKILAMLPEWVWEALGHAHEQGQYFYYSMDTIFPEKIYDDEDSTSYGEMSAAIYNLYWGLLRLNNVNPLDAAAKLLHLLWEEKLI